MFQIITCLSSSPGGVQLLQPFVPAIWEKLFRHCECGEEGTRNVVAECLGKLTLIDPASLLPGLKESLRSDSPLMRTTIVTAVKFTISDQVLKCVTTPLYIYVHYEHTVWSSIRKFLM
jgi:cullin-associated NEDD8-dissociated protein 1